MALVHTDPNSTYNLDSGWLTFNGSGYMSGRDVTINATIQVSAIRTYRHYNESSTYTAYIFNSNNGALVATSQTVNLTSANGKGIVSMPFASAVNLPAGTYRIGIRVISQNVAFSSDTFLQAPYTKTVGGVNFTFDHVMYSNPDAAFPSAVVTGSIQRFSLEIDFFTNRTPTAPTNLSPGGTTSASPVLVPTLNPLLSWTFNDVDPGDNQSKFRLQIYNMADVAVYNSETTSTNKNFTVPGGVLAWNTIYKWRVQTTDSQGATSGYSSYAFIKTNIPAVTPLSPGSSLSNAPEIIASLTPSVSWAYSDPLGLSQSHIALRVYNEAGTLIYNPGQVAHTANSIQIPNGVMTYGSAFSWTVQVWNSNDASSETTRRYVLPNRGPTTNVTFPSSSTTGSPTIYTNVLSPAVSWTYNDPEGSLQQAIQINIHRGSTLVWDSGQLATTATAYTIPLQAGLSYDVTYTISIRTKDSMGSWGDYSSSKYFHLNRSPNKPTALTPGGGSAATATPVHDNLRPVLSWTFTDNDATDAQAGYVVRIYDATTNALINTQNITQSVANGGTGTHTVASGVLISGKTYKWTVATRDNHNTSGAESDPAFFLTNASPNTPSNPAPAGGSSANPAILNDLVTPTFTWFFTDPNTDVQAAFELRVYNVAGTLLWSTGEITSSVSSYTVPTYNKFNYDTVYQWDVRVKDVHGAWSNYTPRGFISIILGSAEGLTATADPFTASIVLDWHDSNAEGLQGYNVYRATAPAGPFIKINANIVTVSNYTDQNVSTGNTYYYRVRAVISETQMSAFSSTVSAKVVFSAWFIGSFKFAGPTKFDINRPRIQSVRSVLGKTRKVVQDKGFSGAEIEMQIELYDDSYSTGATKYHDLMAELNKLTPLALRDPFGRNWLVSPGPAKEKQLKTGRMEFIITIPFIEVQDYATD